MYLKNNLTEKQLKKILEEYQAHQFEKKVTEFKEKYGIVDEGAIVSEDDLITDEKLANSDKED